MLRRLAALLTIGAFAGLALVACATALFLRDRAAAPAPPLPQPTG